MQSIPDQNNETACISSYFTENKNVNCTYSRAFIMCTPRLFSDRETKFESLDIQKKATNPYMKLFQESDN